MIVLVANDVCQGYGEKQYLLTHWESVVHSILRRDLLFNYDQYSGKLHKKVKSVCPLPKPDYEAMFSGSKTLEDMQIDLAYYIQQAEEEDISDAWEATLKHVKGALAKCGIEVDYDLNRKINNYMVVNVVWDYDTETLMNREFEV